MGNQSEDLDVEGASARATLRRQPRLRTTREGEIFFSDAIRRGARALSEVFQKIFAEFLPKFRPAEFGKFAKAGNKIKNIFAFKKKKT